MVAFIVFWCALFCVIFFLLGTVFKGLSSLFTGAITSSVSVIAIAVLTALGVIALYAIYGIASGIRISGFGHVLGMLVMLVIEIGIIVALVGGVGAWVFEIVVAVLEFVIDLISTVLEAAAAFCEKAYVHFLMAIIKRLDKC